MTTKDIHAIKEMESKAKKSCIVYFQLLHSHLKSLSNNDLKGTQTEYGFKLAFVTLFGQDVQTFTGTMFFNVDQLEKQLDKEEFQETRSMAAFRDTSSRLGNDADADDAYIGPIYDEEPMDIVQTNAENNIFATAQQHAEQPEFNNKGKVDQNAEQCHEKRPFIASLADSKTTELSNQSLKYENICLKKTAV
ncbi:hypothetical protein Tco_1471557 [Tanacetum coccineum]